TVAFSPETAVNNDANTITFASPHGLRTGDAVVYHTDPTLRLDGLLGGEALTDKDPPIGELEDGNLYYVVKIDDNTIRLTSSKQGATDAEPIDLTPGALGGTDLGSGHTLGTDGVGIHAELEAKNLIISSSRITHEPFGW